MSMCVSWAQTQRTFDEVRLEHDAHDGRARILALELASLCAEVDSTTSSGMPDTTHDVVGDLDLARVDLLAVAVAAVDLRDVVVSTPATSTHRGAP